MIAKLSPFYRYYGSYLLRLFGIFALLFYGTSEVVMRVVTPGRRFYIPFLNQYFNYLEWLRKAVIHLAWIILKLLSYPAIIEQNWGLAIGNKHVFMAHECTGYGVMAFWIAFVFAITANKKWLHQLKWIAIGIAAICLVNSLRIISLLLTMHYHWPALLPFDHHTNFNIIAYIVLAVMMKFYINHIEGSNEKGIRPA